MARYKYVCINGHEQEVIKAMVEFDRPEFCPECQTQMVNILDIGGIQFMNAGGLAGTRSQT